MPEMPRGHCSVPLCPYYQPCPQHRDPRPSAYARGYGGKRWKGARRATIRRDPFCTCPGDWPGCAHEPGRCMSMSTVADHDPRERVDLVAEGVKDPDDPKYLRGLCASCHSRKTAHTRPSGWGLQQ